LKLNDSGNIFSAAHAQKAVDFLHRLQPEASTERAA
jgi:antirestriction protein ArdC